MIHSTGFAGFGKYNNPHGFCLIELGRKDVLMRLPIQITTAFLAGVSYVITDSDGNSVHIPHVDRSSSAELMWHGNNNDTMRYLPWMPPAGNSSS